MPALAGVLVIGFLAQCFLAERLKSPAWDEPVHIAAGLSYWLTDKMTVNLQHPPLLKDLIGLSTLLSGARWPSGPQAQRLLAGDPHLQWPVGSAIIGQNPDKVMFWARLPMILVGALGAVLLYLWGRFLLGGLAAAGAVFLYALDPTIVAHASLTTFDTGFAVFTLLFLFALWSYLQYPSTRRLILCGLALGAVLTTKFSAAALLPVAAVLVATAACRPPAAARPCPGAFLTLYGPTFSAKAKPNDPCPCGSGRKFKKCHGAQAEGLLGSGAVRRFAVAALVLVAMCAIAAIVIELVYFFPGDPFLYIKGMRLVNADHIPNYDAVMAGRTGHFFFSYFAVAYLLKEPVPSIILAICGLFLVLRSKTISLLDKLFLLLPPAVLFAAHTFLAALFGIRYIIPALPFAYLLGGIALAFLLKSPRLWQRAAAGLFCAWMLAAAIGIYPDHLSYFNETACLLTDPSRIGLDGGSRCGTFWLDESNVDWGGGLKQLRAWLDRHAPGRPFQFSYFGSFPPAYYGLPKGDFDPGDVKGPPPGLYVLSGHVVARTLAVMRTEGTDEGEWVRRIPPAAIVGHCLYVYDVR